MGTPLPKTPDPDVEPTVIGTALHSLGVGVSQCHDQLVRLRELVNDLYGLVREAADRRRDRNGD